MDTVSEWIGEPPSHYLTKQEAEWLEPDKRTKEEAEVRRSQKQEERDRKLDERKAKATRKTKHERGAR